MRSFTSKESSQIGIDKTLSVQDLFRQKNPSQYRANAVKVIHNDTGCPLIVGVQLSDGIGCV